MADPSPRSRQRGFNLIELGQIVFLLSCAADVHLLVNHNAFGVPLAYLLANFIAGVITYDKTVKDVKVFGQRVGRILFVVLFLGFAPLVWWLDSLIAAAVCSLVSYFVAVNFGRLWPSRAAGSGEGKAAGL